MNKYFKPLDWEINDYLSYINEPSSIDLSPYLQYIVPEDVVSEDKTSIEEPTSTVSFLTPKVEFPKSKPISIPKKDTRGESKIIYTRRELNPKEFVSDFTNRYIQKGVNPEVAKIIAVQNLLESRSKDTKYYSQLADQYHNYGGVKWLGSLSDPSKYVTFDSEEEESGVRSTKSSAFRVFKDKDEYVDYVIDLLKRRYDLRLDMSYTEDEYLSSLMGNNRSGYKWATASNYADTIRSMAKRLKGGGILKLQSGSKIDRVNGDYIHQFPKLWDILTYSGISDVTGNTLDYIATMPKVDAEVLTPILLRLEDYLSRNNKISWEDLTSNEKYNLINLSSNLNKLDFSKGFTNGLDDDFRYLQGLVSSVSNDELDSLLNMDLSPTTIKEGIQLLKNKPKSIKLSDIKRVANIFNKKYDAGLDTGLIGLKLGGRLKYSTSPNDKIDYLTEKLKKGGRIEKASLGTIFSTNKPRDQRRSGVALKDYYDWYNYHNNTYGNGSHSLPEEFGSIILDPGLDNYNIKEDYVPTINDLLEFTTSYEGFKSKPYELNGQILIGHGLSDESLIEKYRYTGIPEDVSREEVLSRLKDILSRHEELVPGFKELPMSIKLAITDTVYNGKGDNELINANPISKRLKAAIAKGDVMSIVKELDHSKSAGGWLGIRSAARRAMALGEYMWDYKYKDRLGRHINPSKSHDKDYMTSPYVKYIDM